MKAAYNVYTIGFTFFFVLVPGGRFSATSTHRLILHSKLRRIYLNKYTAQKKTKTKHTKTKKKK